MLHITSVYLQDWMESRRQQGKSIHPYCNKVKRDPLETECTEDRCDTYLHISTHIYTYLLISTHIYSYLHRSSVALCNLVHHGHLLPPPFQNFDSIPHVAAEEVGHVTRD